METMTNVNIRMSETDKEKVTNIFENLGLNMSTAVNMFVKQVIRTNSIPFKIECSNNNIEEKLYNNEKFVKNYEEGEKILKEIKNGSKKGYDNMDDLLNALNQE